MQELRLAKRQAFVTVKDILAKVSALAHPDPDAMQYHLVIDISNYVLGVALYQIIKGDLIPIGLYSKELSETQSK